MRTAIMTYVAGLAAALVLYYPATAVDLNTLIPVEMLWVERNEGMYVICGKDVEGRGESWREAMADLEACADGMVFLETVDRVVISLEARGCMQEMLRDERLRPSVQLYYLKGTGNEILESFTAAHTSHASIGSEAKIPLITEEEGRYRLAGTE